MAPDSTNTHKHQNEANRNIMTNSTINNVFATNDNTSAIPLRLIAGTIFAAHGGQKLFAWFGGYGIDGTGQWMESIGLAPGYLMAIMAGSAEFFGGLLLIVGLLTRPTALILAVTMIVAIFSVHIHNGLFMSNNGYEFGLALIAISIALLVQGGGKYSLDNIISRKLRSAA